MKKAIWIPASIVIGVLLLYANSRFKRPGGDDAVAVKTFLGTTNFSFKTKGYYMHRKAAGSIQGFVHVEVLDEGTNNFFSGFTALNEEKMQAEAAYWAALDSHPGKYNIPWADIPQWWQFTNEIKRIFIGCDLAHTNLWVFGAIKQPGRSR